MEPSSPRSAGSPPAPAATADTSRLPVDPAEHAQAIASELEIIFRPDPTIWDGRFANNGWLQELPKPLTKITWDTTALGASRIRAEEHGLRNGDVIELRYRGNVARMPVWRVPGQPRQSVTVFFGYGRHLCGPRRQRHRDAEQFNAFLLRTSDAPWFGTGLEIAKTGERYLLATHAGTPPDGRASSGPCRDPRALLEGAGDHQGDGETPSRTHRAVPRSRVHRQQVGDGDRSHSCTGCSACTIACVAENNIPVVGKDQVSRGREMHWIRVDHYFEGTLDDPGHDNPKAVHQPVPCMQCENAPCELVCPVAATTHSSEGLNDMVYNRCVGTRYCSNNCPYKVRRFNFLLYQDWTTPSLEPLRNPDVTVRSRGVMEKCTYCVQRINQARIDAKREDREIRDGEIVTACEAVCPADAIVFGNLNDPNSRVAKLKAQERNYGVLEDLNTRPRTSYLAALRNPNPELERSAARG